MLRMPDVAKRLRDLSATPVGSSPAETAAFIKRERERWQEVIAAIGIKPE
jgi:tripartite-type tricarboxylate transporter receptor subunit TctC